MADSPDPVAQADQLGASLRMLAQPLGQFYEGLLDNVDEEQAMVLVRDYLDFYLAHAYHCEDDQ